MNAQMINENGILFIFTCKTKTLDTAKNRAYKDTNQKAILLHTRPTPYYLLFAHMLNSLK